MHVWMGELGELQLPGRPERQGETNNQYPNLPIPTHHHPKHSIPPRIPPQPYPHHHPHPQLISITWNDAEGNFRLGGSQPYWQLCCKNGLLFLWANNSHVMTFSCLPNVQQIQGNKSKAPSQRKPVCWLHFFFWIISLIRLLALLLFSYMERPGGQWTPSISWIHDDIIKWKHFLRYWRFVPGIHWSPVNSQHKGQWCGALMFSLICAWINGLVVNREAGYLRRHRAHYNIRVRMTLPIYDESLSDRPHGHL